MPAGHGHPVSHPPGIAVLMDPRHRLGAGGEDLAAHFLARHGAVVLDRNVAVGAGELDLIVAFGRRRVAVEVRTVTGPIRPDERFTEAKRRQVHALARAVGIRRVDFVGVGLLPDRAEFRWLRDVPAE